MDFRPASVTRRKSLDLYRKPLLYQWRPVYRGACGSTVEAPNHVVLLDLKASSGQLHAEGRHIRRTRSSILFTW